jgi:Sulfatase
MKRPVEAAASVFGLWAVAVLQPLLAPLGAAPEFFVAHRSDPVDILAVTAALALGPPVLACVAIALVLPAGRRAMDVAAALAVGLVAAPLAAQIGYRAGVTGWPAALAVAAAGLAVTGVAWHQVPVVRSFLALLSPAIVVVPVLFLSGPGMRSLLWRTGDPAGVVRAASPAPIVIVVFDELSLASLVDGTGRLNEARCPNFAALARDGIWFRRATTVSDFTRWALPAIMTGRYPRPDSAPTAADHANSIFTALGPSYHLEVTEPMTSVCPAALCGRVDGPRADRLVETLRDVRVVASYVLLPPAAREWLPSLTQGWANFETPGDGDDNDDPHDLGGEGTPTRDGRIGPRVLGAVRSFVDGISPDDPQPTLYFMHTLISHHPPRWLPSGQLIADRDNVPGRLEHGRWAQAPRAVAAHYQGHLLQAALADRVVGWIRDRLIRADLYERTLVVVVADHGASFRPGDSMRALTDTNAGDIAPVPLVVKLPQGRGPAGVVDDRNVQTVDILPTIADVIDLDLPFAVDGRSALAAEAPSADKRVYHAEASQISRYSLDAIVRLEEEAFERQRALFTEGPWPATRLPGFDGLLGRKVETLRVEDAPTGLLPRIARPLALEQVDPAAPALPVQVVGTIEPESRVSRTPAPIAVVVNGEVVAMTTTLVGSGRWFALIPPRCLERGANRLQVFVLDPTRPGVLLRPGADPREDNLVLDGATRWGVQQRGLYGTEAARGRKFRWTTGRAVIDVPIVPGHRPTRLRIAALSSGPAGKQLRLLVDSCEVLSTRLSAGGWSRTVELGRCQPDGYWAEVEILSDTHTPGGGDRRALGVALGGLTLE